LRSAGVRDLFDALVEGREAAELDLPGKPDPATLLEAADRLGVSPERAAVIEDATAGVEAAVRGGFGLVIGVDRASNRDALRRAGAHLVVRHLGEVTFVPDKGLSVKTLSSLPLVRDREEEIRDLLSGRALAVFLDYDGTLTPIVDDYTKAFLADDMRAAVAELARHCTVAIVSGRGVDHLRQVVQLDSVYYAGSHGFEIAVPDGKSERFEKGAEFLLCAPWRTVRWWRTGLATMTWAVSTTCYRAWWPTRWQPLSCPSRGSITGLCS